MAKYPWQRRWYPAGTDLDLDSDGFLVDPDSPYGHYLNRKARHLENLTEVPCLILLGDPGMGKTEDLRGLAERPQTIHQESRFIELGHYGSESRLVEAIFKPGGAEDWLPAEGKLHLLLDSFDEGLLGVHTLHHLIVDELKARTSLLSRERLRLRITCRSALWPDQLDRELRKLWPSSSVETYFLAPLTQRDVEQAAEVEGLDSHAFLEEVRRVNGGPLAARPITLRMLFDLFRKGERLPESQVVLYERGCLALCRESNEDRQTQISVGELDSGERLECASRIAAGMTLANRRYVQLSDKEPPGEETVALSELLGSPSAGERTWRERDLREVVEVSGLFRGAGWDRLEWAHQTYAEFLAARYLHRRNLGPQAALRLITHPEHPDQGVVPGFQGTASWLAGMNDGIFAALLEREPEILLQSDVATANAGRKTQLVETLLCQVEAGDLHFSEHLDFRQFHRLKHPGLRGQLAPVLSDPDRPFGARLTAIRLAQSSKLVDLQETLVRLALAATEDADLRISAIHALSELADVSTLDRLRVLLPRAEACKEDHRIGASVLEVLWPELLTADELFEVLARAEVARCLGKYSWFLYKNPARYLKPTDLPAALTWLATRPYRQSLEVTHKSRLVLGVLEQAWCFLDEAGIADALAITVTSLTRRNGSAS